MVIVDALEQVTEEGANALLKSLEEPRPDVTFVLVCHQLSATLPTIRSRCRLVRVNTLTEAEVRQVVRMQGGEDAWVDVAGGCPGTVLGDSAKVLRDTMVAVAGVVEGKPLGKPVSAAQAPYVPQAVLALLAVRRCVVGDAKVYAEVVALQKRAAEMNLPAGLVAEAALVMVRGAA